MNTHTSRTRALRLPIALALTLSLAAALGGFSTPAQGAGQYAGTTPSHGQVLSAPSAVKPAARGRSGPVSLITQNIRYGPGVRKDRRLLAHLNRRGADYLLIQEARDVNLSRILPPGLGHNQVLTNNGTKGSAVAWRKPARAQGITKRRQHQIVHGKRYGLGVNRYASIIDTFIQGKRTRIVSLHYAPQPRTWKATHAAVRTVLNRRPAGSEFIVGGDFNQMHGTMTRHLGGGRAYGERIDGFVVSKGLKVRSVRIDTFGKKIRATDHRAVKIVVSRR